MEGVGGVLDRADGPGERVGLGELEQVEAGLEAVLRVQGFGDDEVAGGEAERDAMAEGAAFGGVRDEGDVGLVEQAREAVGGDAVRDVADVVDVLGRRQPPLAVFGGRAGEDDPRRAVGAGDGVEEAVVDGRRDRAPQRARRRRRRDRARRAGRTPGPASRAPRAWIARRSRRRRAPPPGPRAPPAPPAWPRPEAARSARRRRAPAPADRRAPPPRSPRPRARRSRPAAPPAAPPRPPPAPHPERR